MRYISGTYSVILEAELDFTVKDGVVSLLQNECYYQENIHSLYPAVVGFILIFTLCFKNTKHRAPEKQFWHIEKFYIRMFTPMLY